MHNYLARTAIVVVGYFIDEFKSNAKMKFFVVFGVLATFASLANAISEPSAPLLNGTYQSLINAAALDIFDKNISNGMYPSVINVAAMDIFDETISPPTTIIYDVYSKMNSALTTEYPHSAPSSPGIDIRN